MKHDFILSVSFLVIWGVTKVTGSCIVMVFHFMEHFGEMGQVYRVLTFPPCVGKETNQPEYSSADKPSSGTQ